MSLKRRIFSIFAAIVMIFGSMPMPFLSAYAEDDLPAAGDVPRSLKKVTSNHDGTYDISLEIEGVSKEVNDAVKANVVVVFDTSGSMGYDAVTYNYTASNNGRYGLVNGDYLNLYKYTSYGWFGGDCELINNDWTSGTVYSDAGCRNRYNGTRYTRSVAENLGTRMQVAKDAVNGLANQLLAQNDPDSEDYKDVVEITLIDFATTSSLPRTPTTDLNTFKGWVNGLSVSTGDDAGTNWEDALDRANKVTFDNDGDKIYIIFVSDGDPTFRNSKFSNNANDCEWGWGRTCPPNPFGNGNNDNNSWNLGAAQVITASITAEGSNKELYTVGTFGDVHNMESLGGTYYNAVDQEALETAFASIVQKITKGLSVTDIKISDGITAATATEVSGTAGNFRYEVPEAWGSEPGVDFAAAQFNGTTVTWEPGQDKTLSTNETAKVTFTVWPSQAAMDCIAKIRNEENEAACDLGEGETLASYGLVKNGNKYELMTNSEATFTYRTRTDTNGTITVSAESDDQPFEERRDDTTLPETTLRVTKIWKDGMNAEQRDDIKDVKLDLYVDREEDSEPVETFTFDKTQQTGNEWVGNRENGSYDYTVAPGVMKKLTGLSEAEAASLRAVALAAGEDRIVTVGTDEYAILEKGRDYEFE